MIEVHHRQPAHGDNYQRCAEAAHSLYKQVVHWPESRWKQHHAKVHSALVEIAARTFIREKQQPHPVPVLTPLIATADQIRVLLHDFLYVANDDDLAWATDLLRELSRAVENTPERRLSR